MKLLPDPCLVLKNTRLDFGANPNYDPDSGSVRICMKLLTEACVSRAKQGQGPIH